MLKRAWAYWLLLGALQGFACDDAADGTGDGADVAVSDDSSGADAAADPAVDAVSDASDVRSDPDGEDAGDAPPEDVAPVDTTPEDPAADAAPDTPADDAADAAPGDTADTADTNDTTAGDTADGDGGDPEGFGTISGQVLMPVEDDFAPVPGARVWVDGLPAVEADDQGVFLLEGVPAGLVRVFAAGPTYDRLSPQGRLVYGTTAVTAPLAPDGIQTVIPRILLGCALNVEWTEGGLIDLAQCGSGGGIRLGFPPDAFTEPEATDFPTAVRVEMAVLDPARGTTFTAVPMAADGTSPFETSDVLGGFEVRLLDAATREPLQLAPGATATVRFPVHPLPDDAAPEDVAVQRYDADAGEWVAEPTGAFVSVGDETFYELEVGHFSAYMVEVRYGGIPQSGCLRLYPVLAPDPPIACLSDGQGGFLSSCPDPLGGTDERPCLEDTGVCGCYEDSQCPNDSYCGVDQECHPSPTCPGTACRGGLACLADGTCGCSDTFLHCSGDTECINGLCRELGATVDIYTLDAFNRTHFAGTVFGDLDECHGTWPDRRLELDIRYVNPFLVFTGHPVYRWHKSGVSWPIELESLTDDVFEVPDIAGACLAADARCAQQMDPETGDPFVLEAQGRSCAIGRVVDAYYGSFDDTPELPIRGLFQLRDETGQVLGATVADSAGRFCVSTPLSAGPVALTQGDFPDGEYYTVGFDPTGDPRFRPGGRCGDGKYVPPTGCADLGLLSVDCEPELGGSCMRALFDTQVERAGDVDDPFPFWRVRVDASESTGHIGYYEWEVFEGHRPYALAVSASTQDPTWEVTLPRGTYTIRLTLVGEQRWDWAFASETITLQNELRIPRSLLAFGCHTRSAYPSTCVVDEDCPMPFDCRGGNCRLAHYDGWGEPCASQEDCDLPEYVGRDGVDYLQCQLPSANPTCQRVVAPPVEPALCYAEPYTVPLELPEFLIGVTEVTQSQYAICVDEGDCVEPDEGCGSYDPFAHPEWPVTCVTHAQAEDYCEFVGRRLPTSAEWELAARGPFAVLGGCDPADNPLDPFCEADGQYLYPWGNGLISQSGAMGCELANVDAFDPNADGSCDGQLVDVGSHPAGASPLGALDMVGNAWEWVADVYTEAPFLYAYHDTFADTVRALSCLFFLSLDVEACLGSFALLDPREDAGSTDVTVRGPGAEVDDPEALGALRRIPVAPATVSATIGFRCAAGDGDPGYVVCPDGEHDGGDGSCVAEGDCSSGYHDGGAGICIADGTDCIATYHDGGAGECVPLGFCSDGYHDGGDGDCQLVGTCAAGYRDGGGGTCVDQDVCAPGYYEVGSNCVPLPSSGNAGLHIQLEWDTPGDPNPDDTGFEAGADVDLHLWNGLGEWNTIPNDCHWLNLTPDWGQAGNSLDDPDGDVDDTDGWGPETIILPSPEGSTATPRTYHVGVHYYDDHGYGGSEATVRIYVGGVLVGTYRRDLAMTDFWEVATITYPPADALVEAVNTVTTVDWGPDF